MDQEMRTKRLALGIDTGGTYTDGVLMQMDSDQVLAKTKVNTTREDLSIGIGACIDALGVAEKKDEIAMVCLSTTLATNTVVEGKISRVGLILMNRDRITERFTVDKQYQIPGIINISGLVDTELDEEEASRVILEMQGEIDSLVISGYLSVRNPAHELRVKALAMELLDVPVICAHELSMSLGFAERTATAVLNAHLMPVIDDLIRKTRQTLDKNCIDAHIMIVKGDGTMMEEQEARERPVETVLSGPAASVIGGAFLMREENAMFVDLGGTTTDIALMKDGKVSVADEGATINGWKTKVRAVDIHTFGLGGDSRLWIRNKEYGFGPVKAVPICFATERYPYLHDEIKSASTERKPVISGFHEGEALILTGAGLQIPVNDHENRVVKLLADGPRSISAIAEHLSRAERVIGIHDLVKKGIVNVISVTPTDLLHASGDFVQWNRQAAIDSIHIAARRIGLQPETAVEELIGKFSDQLTYAIIESAFHFDDNYNRQVLEDPWLYHMLFQTGDASALRCQLKKNIVAIGAPAEAWLVRLAQKMDTQVIAPEHYEVANAIGAAKGVIRKTFETLIRHQTNVGDYRVHTPWDMTRWGSFEEARDYALEQMEMHAAELEARAAEHHYRREWNEKKKYVNEQQESSAVYEATITLELTAVPKYFA